MQDKLMQAQTLPFIKLAQGNMEMFTRFSSWLEMTAQAASLYQHATESATSLMHSGAVAQMMRGMMKNYSEYFMQLNQNAMALMSQGQAAMVREVQEAGEAVVDGKDMRVRRSRQAA